MSDILKKVIPIYLILVIYLFINNLVRLTVLSNIYIAVLNPLFLLLIAILVYYITKGFKVRTKNKNIKNKRIITILISYFFIYYLSGLVFGFTNNELTIGNFFNSFISYFLVVIFREYIRYRLICSSKKPINLFVITLLFILLEIDFNYLFSNFFEYFWQGIIPIIIMNITSTYLIYRISSLTNYIYRGTIAGINLFLPIIPKHGMMLTNLFLLILLVILVLYIDHLVELEERRQKRNKKENPILTGIFLMLVSIFLLFMLGCLKYQPIAILSDSMKDYYARGDVVVIEKIDEEDIPLIKKDDIIYYQYDGRYITHRVYDIKVSNNAYIFYTKGDNNETIDDWSVKEEDIIGIVRFKVKYLGWPSVWLNELFS